jgi:hypothetical protein
VKAQGINVPGDYGSLSWFINNCALHRKPFVEGMRQMCSYSLDHKFAMLFKRGKFNWHYYDIAPEELVFQAQPDGTYEFHVVVGEITAQIDGRRSNFNFGNNLFFDCAGSLDDITDYCLLRWRRSTTNSDGNRIYQELLTTVTGQRFDAKYETWLQWRLKEAQCSDEKDWISTLLHSDNSYMAPGVIIAAADVNMPGIEETLCRIAQNEDGDERMRGAAIEYLGKSKSRDSLMVLAAVLNDNNIRIAGNHLPWNYPLNPWFNDDTDAFTTEVLQKQKTLGQLAHERLKKLTGQDFGTDKDAWTKWIAANGQ